MSDSDILHEIAEMVAEEKRLRDSDGLDDADRARIRALEIDLDRCWDLLRRREAREEFGQDPSLEHEMPASVVEKYLQ